MELVNLFRAIMLYASNLKPGDQFAEDIGGLSDSGISVTQPPPPSSSSSLPLTVNLMPLEADNDVDEHESFPLTAFVPYDFDCGMPFPPNIVRESAPLIVENSPALHDTSSEYPHAKVTFRIPLHVVHKLPDSELTTLHRFEDYCEDTILDVYSAIKDFNNYNYEKNQEIQYMSYKEERKQEFIEQSKNKKSQIQIAYNKMHQVCDRCERHRERITNVLHPYLQVSSMYYAQPKRVPKSWYDIHNLETVIQQLFTPKLKVRMHLVDPNNELRMSRMPMVDPARKEFIPLPQEYLNDKSSDGDDDDDETVDGASLIVENNQPATAIEIFAQKTEQFNDNILEQYTFSTNKDIQQVIIYYVYKYYELKVRDGTRKVFHFTRMLKNIRETGGSETAISNLEDRVADAVKELQQDTIEMERNRVVPELIGLYNAENEAHNLLPNTKCMTKLIGTKNRRVITAFNPSESIRLNALATTNTHLRTERTTEHLSRANADDERENLDEPLYWDQNWMWDY